MAAHATLPRRASGAGTRDACAHYYKYEGVSPVGSHKPNTAVAQAFYNKQAGTKRLATETGAGQWGSALAMACNLFGLECTVSMVKVSYHQKPYRRVLMETYGATVHASPTNLTNAGRGVLEQDPDSNGSLGISISEAVEDAATHDDTHYSLGSVLNHVLLHQSVVGLEAQAQLESVGERADAVIGCVGGGSNFAGLSYPFLGEQFRGERSGLRAVAAEPAACPTLTRGTYAYDFGDTAMMAPIVPMYTLGHSFVPPAIAPVGSDTTAMRRRCPNSCWTGIWKRSRITRTRRSRPASSSRARRASSRHPRQPRREAAIDEAVKAGRKASSG